MIPYQLKIHGIRDYAPRIIQLGEPSEHILITGPNGVGKSTLTFCLGAVLNSAKVDVEGLRSTNLKANEPWYARIQLVFLNEGETRVDGPKYIAFQLTVKQDVKNGPMQREFEVLNGSHVEKLLSQTKYTSGGTAGHTLTAYKEDLQMRYKIDPDHYYLIWYQQEVNQFAAMYPEERFRKFSNMFGISDMQKEWEASLAQIKEVQEEISRLRATQKSAEIMVNAAQTELKQYLDNKKRLQQSGQRYYTLLHGLIEKYEDEVETLAAKKTQNQIEKDKQLVRQQELKQEMARLNVEKTQLSDEQSKLQEEVEQISEQLMLQQSADKDKQKEQKQLEQQLESVSENRKLLQNDEETTKYKLEESKRTVRQLKLEMAQVIEKKSASQTEERKLMDEKAALKFETAQLKAEMEKAQVQLKIYKSSAHVQQQMDAVLQQNTEDFEAIERKNREIKRIKEAMAQTKQKKFISLRQQVGLKDLKKYGFEAYTLRELVELIPTVPVQLERQLESVKYSIFYVGKNYKPMNDLYYVSLNQIIPTESVSKVVELGLQIRSDLNEEMGNYANKALWWVMQFFKETPKIEQGLLFDERGVRGAQETKHLILSDALLEKLHLEQVEQFDLLSKELEKITSRYDENRTKVQQLTMQLSIVNTAESTLLKQTGYNEKVQQLEMLEAKMEMLVDEQKHLDSKIQELNSQLSRAEHDLSFYLGQMEIHEQLGAFAEQQLHLERIKNERKEILRTISEVSAHLEEVELAAKKVRRSLLDLEERIEVAESNIKTVIYEITSLDLSIKKVIEKLQSDEARQQHYVMELQDLENMLPEEMKQILQLDLANPSISYFLNEIEPVKVAFNQARSENVNENAQYNYDQQKADFDRKNADLAEGEQLLESNTIRAKDLEDKLETTINMYLTRINTLFEKYMDLFQFEGRVEKERIEEKNGRVRFQLFIKARKIGHQGSLDDVSVKARSGKVGKGVSGGEESLSSLLFALSLLQNLSISPGYIVLDEFDSALDDERKNKVFKLYADELQRKLIIVSPKGHDEAYYNYFSKVFIIEHDATIPRSTIRGIRNMTSTM